MKKFLLFIVLSLSFTDVAASQVPSEILAATVDESISAPMPDCKEMEKEVVGITGLNEIKGGEKLVALYGALIVGLRMLANLLGFLAGKGNATASKSLIVIRYVIMLLGWLSGKLGWGQPKFDSVKKFPTWGRAKAPKG